MTDETPSTEAPQDDWASAAEQRVLDAALRLAPQHGWGSAMAARAGAAEGLSAGETELLLPHGAADLAALLSRRHDARALAALAGVEAAGLKIRERVFRAVEARIDAAAEDEAALGRWMGFLALAPNVALAGRLAWESADRLWRWAGDTAMDENHYSKRLLLAGILTGALAVRVSSGRGEALAFAARRIENVMAFEKWKATTRFRPAAMMTGVAQALGRLRYR